MAGLDGDRRERDKAKCCEAGPMGRARPADPSRGSYLGRHSIGARAGALCGGGGGGEPRHILGRA